MSEDGHWYKDAVLYQLRVASFKDSNADGFGDLRGLTEKLDYLQDLGVTAVWLLPFYPSPMRDDGYDIADYTSVNPQYGSMRDFRVFLKEAHKRGLKVVTELVLNHTSDQHPWFQRARRAPAGSRWRDFYVWSDTPQRYAEARIIFKDFETSNWAWDPLAKSYYWHRFYSHQPDLNFDNPEVGRALFQVVDQWLELGVDGLRLDAVPYLFEREATSCENLPETHAFLKELRAHVESRFQGRMLLAEANQWPEDAAAYFGKGDECQMAFHFPIMPRLYMSIHMEDRYPILDIIEQTPAIPDSCQWAIFLRNHDELTLEMVTDEERDYLWRVYARDPRARINLGIRRRLAPLLGNNRRRIELMNALLLSLPGTPVIYYGDEIGMGDNVYLGDRNGVRTPMQWTSDRNAGFSRANPQRLFLPVVVDPEYHYEALNVETQQGNPSSLLWWTKRILALRKQFRAFGRGTLEFLTPANRKVLAFVRRFESERLLVVVNLSRFSQYAELDLSEFAGCVPIELFGSVEFPPVRDSPYLLTLSPHSFYWFSLETPSSEPATTTTPEVPSLELEPSWRALLGEPGRRKLEQILPGYLRSRRWFRSKARSITRARVADSIPLASEPHDIRLVLVEVQYRDGDPETYALVLALVPAEGVAAEPLARLVGAGADQLLLEAAGDPTLAGVLLDLVARRRRLRGRTLELQGVPARALRQLRGDGDPALPVRVLGAEQSNSSWVFGERLVGKLYRRVEAGTSVELEVLRFLSQQEDLTVAPTLAGHLQLRSLEDGGQEPVTLAVLQAYTPNEGDAWSFTLDEIERAFEELLASPIPSDADAHPEPAPAASSTEVEPEPFAAYLEHARLLGQRTAEMHRALASAPDDAAFHPEVFSPFTRRSLYQSQRNLTARTLDLLRARESALSEADAEIARGVLTREEQMLARFRGLLEERPAGMRIRCHGDYHLGQVLYTGRDFVVIDFEGEPARPLSERRLKRSPLLDVAGMLRSFHYAVESVLRGLVAGSRLLPGDAPRVQDWGRLWFGRVRAVFLEAYLAGVATTGLVPAERADFDHLLEVHLLQKALYELAYELNNRPDWAGIPLRGIAELLGRAESPGRGPG